MPPDPLAEVLGLATERGEKVERVALVQCVAGGRRSRELVEALAGRHPSGSFSGA